MDISKGLVYTYSNHFLFSLLFVWLDGNWCIPFELCMYTWSGLHPELLSS